MCKLSVPVASALLIATAVLVTVPYYLFQPGDPSAVPKTLGWFGRGAAVDADGSAVVTPYTIEVSDEALTDLQRRLDTTRFFEDLEGGSGWDYGMDAAYFKELVAYWRDDYSWRIHEKQLNALPHFITNVAGLDVHFVHYRADADKYPNARPIMLIHGWPGSFYEFVDLLPKLADPLSFGGKTSDAFHVVVPSIPGYGYSEEPHRPGFDVVQAGLVMRRVMHTLGYGRYYVQGGDWGSMIATAMAQTYPDDCIGVHLNLPVAFPPPPLGPLSYVVGEVMPSLVWTENDMVQGKNYPTAKTAKMLAEELGYFHEQATRPHTLSVGLNDSPAGLAAWIVEKFKEWSDCGDDVDSSFSKDALLTNVMIYWTTGTIASSTRFYYENIRSPAAITSFLAAVDVPLAVADFPREMSRTPKSWAAARYRKMYRYTEMKSGGHFAAMEAPTVMLGDIRAAFAEP